MKDVIYRVVFAGLIIWSVYSYSFNKNSSQLFAQDPKVAASPVKKDKNSFFVKLSPGSYNGTKLSTEQKELFEKVKKEIAFCVDQELVRQTKTCPLIRSYKKSKPAPDKNCLKQKNIESELICDKRLISRIPYKSRPVWNEYRAEKIEKNREKLAKMKGKIYKKGHKSNDEEWLKQY